MIYEQKTPLVIDIAHIKSAGGLSRQGVKVELNVGVPITMIHEQNSVLIIVPKVDFSICSQFPQSDMRFWTHFTIDIVYRELEFGPRPYFICPVTNMDCLKLVVLNEHIYSIGFFRSSASNRGVSLKRLQNLAAERKLLKQDGTQRLSPRERDKLLATIESHPERYKTNLELCKLIEGSRRKKESQEKKRLYESRSLSTTTGLDCGRGINQYAIFEEFERADPDWIDQLPVPEIPADVLPDNTENFPELDIKILIERCRLHSPKLTGRTLGWDLESTGDRTIYMFTYVQPDELAQLVFAFETFGTVERVWQKITLLPGPNSGKARYFLCPVSHIRCEALYYRNGLFASREAHRLRIKAD